MPTIRMFQVENAIQEYVLEDTTYQKVSELMLEGMNKGLSNDTSRSAVMKMLVTYVRGLPDGTGESLSECYHTDAWGTCPEIQQ